MRIDINSAAAASITNEDRASKVTPKRTTSEMDVVGVTASLSADSARLSALHSQLSSAPQIRQERVASLRAAVMNGSYQADAGATASAMISEYFGDGIRV